jgi:hypothetical protein
MRILVIQHPVNTFNDPFLINIADNTIFGKLILIPQLFFNPHDVFN